MLQEVLSGVREATQVRSLLTDLSSFPLLLADRRDHLRAAELQRACATAGVVTATADALIAAHAAARGRSLFALDDDFMAIAHVAGLKLHRW